MSRFCYEVYSLTNKKEKIAKGRDAKKLIASFLIFGGAFREMESISENTKNALNETISAIDDDLPISRKVEHYQTAISHLEKEVDRLQE